MENEEVVEQQPEENEDGDDDEGLRKVEVKLSPKYDVPLCYVEFFKNKKSKPKESKEGKEGDEDAKGDEEESDSDSDSDDDIIEVNKKGGKNAGDGEKPNVIVMVKQRSKRKNTTTIANLEPWGVDIKELTKHIKKKMAIGCSTTKTATGQQIVIQGDAGEPVIILLRDEFHIPMKSITPIRKVKKAPEPKQPAAQPQYDLGPSSDDDDGDHDHGEDQNQEEEDTEFENPNRPSKKNKQHQQQQQQHQEKEHENNEENQRNQHHENRGRGGNNNRGGRGGRGGNNNRGGRGGRGGNNRGGRGGRGRH